MRRRTRYCVGVAIVLVGVLFVMYFGSSDPKPVSTNPTPRIELGAPAEQEPKDAQLIRSSSSAPIQLCTLSGHVTERGTGLPVPGAEVEIYLWDDGKENFTDNKDRTPIASARSNNEGFYTIANLLPGDYLVCRKSLAGYIPESAKDRIRKILRLDERHADLDYILEVGGRISGRVIDARGQGIVDALVNLVQSGLWEVASTTTDGQFEFRSAKIGNPFAVLAYASGYQVGRYERTGGYPPHVLRREGLHGVEIVVSDGVRLTGILSEPNGRPIANMKICGNDYPLCSETDSSGEFAIDHLPPGEVRFFVSDPTTHIRFPVTPETESVILGLNRPNPPVRVVATMANSPFDAGEPALDPSSPATTTGYIHTSDGSPVRNASIIDAEFSFIVSTDDDGFFVIDVGLDGTTTIRVSSETLGMRKIHGVVSGSKETVYLVRELVSVSGQVLDAATDTPIRDFRIEPLPESSSASTRFHDLHGRFQFTPQSMNTLRYRVIAEDYSAQEFDVDTDVDAPITGIVLRMEVGSTVRGQVTDADGAPLPFASIYASSSSHHAARTDEVGRYVLKTDVGEQTINCIAIGYQSDSATIDLGAHEDAEIDFALLPYGRIEGTVVQVMQEQAIHRVYIEKGQGYVKPPGYDRSGGYNNGTEVDESGGFQFKDLAPGPYTLRIMSGDDQREYAIEAIAGEVATIILD